MQIETVAAPMDTFGRRSQRERGLTRPAVRVTRDLVAASDAAFIYQALSRFFALSRRRRACWESIRRRRPFTLSNSAGASLDTTT
jgi:hypothetical protein